MQQVRVCNQSNVRCSNPQHARQRQQASSSLHELRKRDLVLGDVRGVVRVLQEHIADDPERFTRDKISTAQTT